MRVENLDTDKENFIRSTVNLILTSFELSGESRTYNIVCIKTRLQVDIIVYVSIDSINLAQKVCRNYRDG
jgi:hypothetical protein